MDMPSVRLCNAENCSYNRDRICHALAITVGGMDHPMCDTFVAGMSKAGDQSNTGRVGACKVDSCTYNQSLECTAAGITVDAHKANDFDCVTFRKR